jgi:threonine synthase
LKEKEGLHVLPASTAGLAALFGMHASAELEADRYVILLTGKK